MKKLSIIAMLLAASVLVACGGAGGSGEKYDLSYKLEPGNTYGQNISMDMDMSASAMGQTMEMNMVMNMGYDYTIADTTDGTISSTVTFKSIGMGIDVMGNSMHYSSDDLSSDDPVVKMLKAIVDKHFDLTMTRQGQVKSITGFEEMMDELYSSIGLSPSEAMQVKAMVEQNFNEEKMMEQFRNMAIYPDHPVAAGDSWSVEVKNAEMELENTYTLKEVADDEITIEVESDVKSMTIPQFTGTMKGTQNGTIVVNRSSGWIKKSDLKQDLSGSVIIEGVDTKMLIKSTLTIGE